MAGRYSIGAFQFKRRSSTIAPSIFTSTSNHESRLQPEQVSNIKRPHTSQNIPIKPLKSTEEKTPPPPSRNVCNKRQKRSKQCQAPHLQVETDLPEEVRMKHLIDIILREEYDAKMKDASVEEREMFEDAMLNMLDFVDEHATQMESSSESVLNKRRPNPANEELCRREEQLEAIVERYREELQEWEKVDAAVGDIESDELAEVKSLPHLTEVVDVEALKNNTEEAMERFVLQSMHVSCILKKLESRNRETKRRVERIADTLNRGVLEEFGEGMNVVAPERLAQVPMG